MKKLVLFAAVAALVIAAPLAFAGEDGKALFEGKCAMCHGKDGMAKPMAKGSRNFTDPAFQKEMTADSIVKTVTDGKNKMPSYKEKLKAEEIKAVAEYVKTLAPAK
jgi:cytochrome c6